MPIIINYFIFFSPLHHHSTTTDEALIIYYYLLLLLFIFYNYYSLFFIYSLNLFTPLLKLSNMTEMVYLQQHSLGVHYMLYAVLSSILNDAYQAIYS